MTRRSSPPWVPPTLGEGNHFSYALQWFAFTVIGVIGLVVLIRGDIRDRRKARRAPQPKKPPTDGAGPSPSLSADDSRDVRGGTTRAPTTSPFSEPPGQ